MFRILFVLRESAKNKIGGDSKKVAYYMEGLKKKGVDCHFCYGLNGQDLKSFDLIHLFNIDLVLETFLNSKIIVNAGVPYVVSTIHHPFEVYSDYYNYGKGNVFFALFRNFLSFKKYSLLKEYVSLALKKRLINVNILKIGYSEMQKFILQNANQILPMCRGEGEYLRKNFVLDASKISVINNAFSFVNTPNNYTDERIFISVGRIEPRKNQLEMIRKIQKDFQSFEYHIVGGLNFNHPFYAGVFLMLTWFDKRINYHGFQKHTEIKKLLMLSNFYLSPSWVEVVSQADLEAASYNLKMIVSSGGYSSEYINNAKVISPKNISKLNIVELIDSLENSTPKSEYAMTWDSVCMQLLEMYKIVLKLP